MKRAGEQTTSGNREQELLAPISSCPGSSWNLEEHPIIFLFVYDVWVKLWGQEFADEQVAVESERRGRYDYESAWRDALALGPDGRAKRWTQFLAERRR